MPRIVCASALPRHDWTALGAAGVIALVSGGEPVRDGGDVVADADRRAVRRRTEDADRDGAALNGSAAFASRSGST